MDDALAAWLEEGSRLAAVYGKSELSAVIARAVEGVASRLAPGCGTHLVSCGRASTAFWQDEHLVARCFSYVASADLVAAAVCHVSWAAVRHDELWSGGRTRASDSTRLMAELRRAGFLQDDDLYTRHARLWRLWRCQGTAPRMPDFVPAEYALVVELSVDRGAKATQIVAGVFEFDDASCCADDLKETSSLYSSLDESSRHRISRALATSQRLLISCALARKRDGKLMHCCKHGRSKDYSILRPDALVEFPEAAGSDEVRGIARGDSALFAAVLRNSPFPNMGPVGCEEIPFVVEMHIDFDRCLGIELGMMHAGRDSKFTTGQYLAQYGAWV